MDGMQAPVLVDTAFDDDAINVAAIPTTEGTVSPIAFAGAAIDPSKVHGRSVNFSVLGLNSPTKGGLGRRKRTTKSTVWGKGAIMRLKEPHEALGQGYTHQCTFESDKKGRIRCGTLLKIGHDKTHQRWVTSVAVRHMKTHADSIAGKAARKRQKVIDSEKTRLMFDYGMAVGASQVAATPDGAGEHRNRSAIYSSFTVSRAQWEATSAAQWYVYSRQRISAASFDDPYFWRMLRAGNTNRTLLTRDQLRKFVRAEYQVFKIFLNFAVERKLQQSLGNPFAQGIHDGVTLGNHRGYESLAMDFVDAEWQCNLVICIGFKPKPMRADGTFNGTDVTVAALYESALMELVGKGASDLIAAMRADRAAAGVARHLGLEIETCGMHDGDKLGSSAIGRLVGKKYKGPIINPFPEGEEIMTKARRMGKYYSTVSRHSSLMEMAENVGNVPTIRIQVPKSETRIAGEHRLLLSEARLNRVLKADTSLRSPEWMLSPDEWSIHGEFEAVLNLTSLSSTLSQFENNFMGAFRSMIKSVFLRNLRQDEVNVINYAQVGVSPHLPRIAKKVYALTPTGRECLRRARLEAERRFCGSTSEEVNGKLVVTMSESEMLATLLDIRTVHCKHLTSEQRENAVQVFVREYVRYYRTAHMFLSKRAHNPEEMEDKAQTSMASVSIITPAIARGTKSNLKMGIMYTGGGWSDDEVGVEENTAVVTPLDHSDEHIRQVALTALKKFRTLKIDWKALYREVTSFPSVPDEVDTFEDMLGINPGRVYLNLQKEDINREKFGLIPAMAAGSKGGICFLAGQSFCERVNSIAKDVMTDAHTLMSDKELEMLVVLRMNRKFMENMRLKHNHLSKQQFGMTLVD